MAATLATLAAPAFALTVAMSGSLGDKALLVIDGTPRTVAAGSSVQGVKLIAVSGGSAVVEINGQRMTLALGGTQANLGGAAGAGSGSQIVMTAENGGHFLANGAINGKAVRFIVDTGATYVSIGAAQAQQLGVDYTNGQPGVSNTANGEVLVYKVKLASLRVGDVQLYDVEAIVSPQPMPAVLLGNNVLMRFQMKRENETLTLTKRF